jgi:hypothetical protein
MAISWPARAYIFLNKLRDIPPVLCAILHCSSSSLIAFSTATVIEAWLSDNDKAFVLDNPHSPQKHLHPQQRFFIVDELMLNYPPSSPT